MKILSTVALVALVALLAGCGKKKQEQVAAGPADPSSQPAMNYCDFKDGPEDAKVKVVAFYPGRHEDTLAAVKGLVKEFPGQVQIDIVDWRHDAGSKRRADAGMTCAGVVINGKNAFDIEVDGKKSKVLFVRGMGGEWTQDDLRAVVKSELAGTK
ncbi:MAG: hypothetical protein KAI66_22275 [Lentisphaeria bacterium]|nr:hypothetical protein [Lentisphaeria bacterium]